MAEYAGIAEISCGRKAILSTVVRSLFTFCWKANTLWVCLNHVIHLAHGGQLQIETWLSGRGLIANMCNVKKFARFCKALKGNTCNVDLNLY